jgi:hypothetical protein
MLTAFTPFSFGGKKWRQMLNADASHYWSTFYKIADGTLFLEKKEK